MLGVSLMFAAWMLTLSAWCATKRVPFAAFSDGALPKAAPVLAGDWSVQLAFPKLAFRNPLGLCAVPGTDELLVWEREGQVWRFRNHPETAEKRLVLDLSATCQGWHDCGLLNVAPHPCFAENGWLFVYYTFVSEGSAKGSAELQPPTDLPNRNRLARYACGADGVANRASEAVLIDQIAESVWHEGGGLFFGPKDGFLYLSTGDDARPGNNQRIDRGFFGGVLRIDVDQRGGAISHPPKRRPLPEGSVSAHYFIPSDNPFVGRADCLEEFFALGLRNPHRMTADPVTGRVFIGDVGEGAQEELNVIEPTDRRGLNFHWNLAEGQPDKPPKIALGVGKNPLLVYRHLEGRAIIAGHVYRGHAFARDLGGKFIFGDNVTGSVWYLDETTNPPSKHLLCTVPDGPGPNAGANYCGLSSFGLDAQGEVYLCRMSSTEGRIFKLSREGPQRVALPKRLSQTKLFTNTPKLTPQPGLLSYDVNSPLWSDGATKSRWMGIPAGKRIGFQPEGAWSFPEGSVFVKHFEMPVTGPEGKPVSSARLETRVLVRDSAGYVYGASYRWRPDNSDADLVEVGQNAPVVVRKGIKGKPDVTQNWYYPGRQDCLACHTRFAGGVLGVNTRQMNRVFRNPETRASRNQLQALAALGLLDRAPKNVGSLAQLARPDDLNASIEDRARSYLDANCSHCHQPNGVHAFWDARSSTPLDEAGIINGIVNNNLGRPDARVVVPRDWTRSVLFQRISVAGQPHSMPPLATQRADKSGIGLIAEWIASMDVEEDGPPPSEWTTKMIGLHPRMPQTTWRRGSFYLSASCHDTWGDSDELAFAHRQPMRAGQITARIVSLTPTNAWTKAGVMIRESTDPESRHAMMVVTPGQGSAFQRREHPASGSTHVSGPAVTAPHWIRLRWKDGKVAAYVSPDAKRWSEVAQAEIPFEGPVLPGLCLSGHNASAEADAAFDSVKVEELAGDLPLSAP